MSTKELTKLDKIKQLKKRKKNKLISIAASVATVATVVGLLIVPNTLKNINSSSFDVSGENISSPSATTVTVDTDGAILCDSLIQGVRDCTLADGTYTFRVKGSTNGGTTIEVKDYKVELINYTSDMHYSLDAGQTSKTVSLGDSTTAYKTLAVKYHGNLTVDKGVTLTATRVGNYTYKKGMLVCVLGDTVNNGNISMTKRGTYNVAGENVYLWKNTNSSFEFVPADGAAGIASARYYNTSQVGRKGNDGTNRGTGSGGTGAFYTVNYRTMVAAASHKGTSYSGGAGTGGATYCNGSGNGAVHNQPTISLNNGGAGAGYEQYTGTCCFAGGGAGEVQGGYYAWRMSVTQVSDGNGTGGLLMLYTNEMSGTGSITAEGSKAPTYSANVRNTYVDGACGGSSGGGSVNIFVKSNMFKGTISANGGATTTMPSLYMNGGNPLPGGAGGNGSVTVTQLYPDVNYPQKELNLNVGDVYTINSSDIELVRQNTTQTGTITLGTISYSVVDPSIASVDSNGIITGLAVGSTKVKIRDITNGLETYIYVNVIDDVKIDVQEGNNFTLALKQNGTVWSYGLNSSGQLGIGGTTNQTTPAQITSISDARAIATGTAHSLVLDKNGDVYSFGLNSSGQLGTGDTTNSDVPVKISTLKDIIKIDAYKNISLAVDKNGYAYVWGDGYSTLPMRVVFSEKVADVSGTIMLTRKGEVYSIKDTSAPISGLTNICKISCGNTHFLALNSIGSVYAWGTNTYGEGGATKGTISPRRIAIDMEDISAGAGTSILKSEDGKAYVLGTNGSGVIGLGTTASVATPTLISLSDGSTVEVISAGEGTHSGIVGTDGFVWHTGTNANGQIGIGDTTNRTAFTKTGSTEVKVNREQIFLDIGQGETIVAVLENTFNLKVDLIDNEQSNFTLSLNGATNVTNTDLSISAVQYGSSTITVKHTPTGKTKNVDVEVAFLIDSLVQGFRDATLPDGDYPVIINGQKYIVELVNYYNDMHYSLDAGQTAKTVTLGDGTTAYKTLVVKYHGDLTVDKGVTLTANSVSGLTYKKGMYICVLGNIENNGNISMTKKGTYNVKGENVYLWKNIDDSYEYVPANGATGIASARYKDVVLAGVAGNSGTNRQTGSGGRGAIYSVNQRTVVTAATGNGNSYSGGAGTGGTAYCNGSGNGAVHTQPAISQNNGGNAAGYELYNGTSCFAGGGAGEKQGTYYTHNMSVSQLTDGNGTGGLLMLYTNVITGTGTIQAEGSMAPTYSGTRNNTYVDMAAGGSSGGGSVNIFAKFNEFAGTISANGGATTTMPKVVMNGRNPVAGGAGGNGSVTINLLGSILNYSGNPLVLKKNDTYSIDTSKLYYTKLNDIQTEDLTVGTLTYESLDTNIATVDSLGNITALKKGTVRIKVTDTTNGYSTYIIVRVINENDVTEPQIEEGSNFTVTLKSNGTVWTYGKNTNGQLGNNTTDDSNKPVQVITITEKSLGNIVDIGAGENASIAVDTSGNVYIWGLHKYLENGTLKQNDLKVATKIAGLSNIAKVEAYKNDFYAIDYLGNVYAFGESYEGIVNINTEGILMKNVSGDLLLGEDGFVYTISNPTTKNPYLYNIIELSKGSTTNGFVTVDGTIRTLGVGTSGELGNGTTVSSPTLPTVVQTVDGILEDVSKVSMGTNFGMAVCLDGKAYIWGNNTAFNLGVGLTDKTIPYATQITQTQNLNNEEINLEAMEIVSAGINKASLMDEYGYVYSLGKNTNGQLGTADNIDRTKFTKIGDKEIITKPDNIIIKQGETKEVTILSGNGFNLKTDLSSNSNVSVTNTNSRKVDVSQIPGVDNSNVTDASNIQNNYKIKGNKIGRVNLVAIDDTGVRKNIWVTVVNDDNDAEVAAKVENGENFSIALRADGTVYSFGSNSNGELGLGDSTDREKPEKITIENDILIKDISVGTGHTLLLTEAGSVYSFGLNKNGQLGHGNNTTYRNPQKISSLRNIVKVVASGNTSFAITEDGQIYAWGDGYTKNPQLVNKVLKTTDENGVESEKQLNIIDVTKEYYLADDGIVRLLKTDKEILLSLNEYDVTDDPVIENERIVQISQEADSVLMLGESGRIYSYGTNTYGQLGDGTTVSRTSRISTAVKIEAGNILRNITEVSAGYRYGIAVTEDGKVYTFGMNEYMKLGFSIDLNNGGIQETGYAKVKEDITDVERVNAGYNHTIVYNNIGDAYTWGRATLGQLGNATFDDTYKPQLVGKTNIQTNTTKLVLEVENQYDVQGDIEYFNVFKDKQAKIKYEILDSTVGMIDSNTGKLMALGEGRSTIIVREDGTSKIAVIPIFILPKGVTPENQVKVEPKAVTYGSHTLMLRVDGTVWSYGIGTYGELGNGTTDTEDAPVQVKFPTGTIITEIAVGENHCIALDSNGNVYTWGRNNYYQLGNTSDTQVTTPKKVDGLSNIKHIGAGPNTSFAINANGEVYGAGLNASGELGVGTYQNKLAFTKAKYITDVIQIDGGKNHTVALKIDGTVYTTGSNLYGELGNNDKSIRKRNLFNQVNIDNMVQVTAGDTSAATLGTDGTITTWGSNLYKELGITTTGNSTETPTKVPGIKNIRYIDGGKNYHTAISSSGDVYVTGYNRLGELGNNTSIDVSTYTKLDSIKNVIGISAGRNYTNYLKEDGTVWGAGDYTHGDNSIKSKTKSSIPIQIGNDKTGFDDYEITVNIDGTKDISKNVSYQFNLIYLDQNFGDTLSYTSLNNDIAEVDSNGIVKGIAVGATRVKAVSSDDNKVYSILVKVIEKGLTTAPKVAAGENFAAVLKADGNIWTFGYNADGRLSLGNKITKDIPTKTNIISTYKDVSAGKDFFIALRQDGTIWTVGNNNHGQLGNGTTASNNKLTQISNIQDITHISAGKDFAVAVDSYGIVYGWGNNASGALGSDTLGQNVLSPIQFGKITQRVIDIAAGEDQTAFVLEDGTVQGFGQILNGIISGINNAVKVRQASGALYILTSDEEVYKYDNSGLFGAGNLTKLNITDVIDIDATNESILMQTVNKETYALGTNSNGELGMQNNSSVTTPTKVASHGENTFGIATGYNNTYIIDNSGAVYASGLNEYGQIGNGTRVDTNEYQLVGDRTSTIEPEALTMNVGDIEHIEVTGNPFNVFNKNTISADEYTIVSDDNDMVLAEIEDGKFKNTAKGEGEVNITVTDKVTGIQTTLKRIVLPTELDRILHIKVNGEEATVDPSSTSTKIKYKVRVITDENTGALKIETKNLNDRISIDDGATWSYNGVLNKQVDLPNKITTIPIKVGIQNNEGDFPEEVEYELEIEKVSNDATIKKITVTSVDAGNNTTVIEATPVNLTKYEVVVDKNTTISLADVLANSEHAEVSINGKPYDLKEQTENIILGTDLSKEVSITIKAESGKEVEYTLVIYKDEEIANLKSIKVNNIEATKTGSGDYSVVVSADTDWGNIVAELDSHLAKLSVNNNAFVTPINTERVELTAKETLVPITVKYNDIEKNYTLHIIKKDKEIEDIDNKPELDLLIVNGTVIMPESDGKTYIAYLPNSETTADLRVVAKDTTTNIDVEDDANRGTILGTGIYDVDTIVNLTGNETKFIVTLTDGSDTAEYTVIIRKADSDANLQKITIRNGSYEKDATKINDLTYQVKVPATFTDVDVIGITSYAESLIDVNQTGNFNVNIDTENVSLTGNDTIVRITVMSKDGTVTKYYELHIIRYSNDASLQQVTVDGVLATLGSDGNYHVSLTDGLTNVLVEAITTNSNADVVIISGNYTNHIQDKNVAITEKQTSVVIRVRAEDGTIKSYTLIIEGLPDNTNIDEVKVNGHLATYNSKNNRYEIRLSDATYNVDVLLEDTLAKLKLGTNAEAIGHDNITITKQGNETIIKVKVTAQNGIDTAEHTIAILEKSSNANLDIIKVNGTNIYPDETGKYVAKLKHDVTSIKVEADAEDEFATTAIDGDTDGKYQIVRTYTVVDGVKEYNYKIRVTAEDGTILEYDLQVLILDGNTNIDKLEVSEDTVVFVEPTLRADGTYYMKVPRVNSYYVRVTLEEPKSTVEINGDSSSVVEVDLPTDVTTVNIKITAEDGTVVTKKLILEKMSNDTSLKDITGADVIRKELGLFNAVYVDEDATEVELTFILNNQYGSIKLDSETSYTLKEITRKISLAGYDTNGYIAVNLDIEAEDGTQETVTVYIYKEPVLDLLSVKVNTVEIVYDADKQRYYALVANGNKPQVIITAKNSKQTVQLIDSSGTTVATGTGTLTTTLTLPAIESEYTIKVISHNGASYGSQTYPLVIRQKSTETGIMSVMVDGLGTSLDSTKTIYSSQVSGKEKYPVVIRLTDSNAKAKLLDSDGNVIKDFMQGTLTTDVAIPDGETKTFTIVVQSENGDEKNYSLVIERISNNTNIGSITVDDLDTDGVTFLTTPVTVYDPKTKTYQIVVSNYLTYTTVNVTTESPKTTVSAEGTSGLGSIAFNVSLPGKGTVTIPIALKAADGSEEERYLRIVQLSDEIGIESLSLDDIVILQNSDGDYEAEITDEFDLHKIHVLLTSERSTVSINGAAGTKSTGDYTVSIGSNRLIEIPIKVTAEDGKTSYTYTLKIHVISHNSEVQEVKVDDDIATYSKEENIYVAYFSKYATSADVTVTPKVPYSTVIYNGVQGTTFTVNTPDLNQDVYEAEFIVKAEDGTESTYKVRLIRKSDDNTIKEVYVDGILITQAADGKYYATVVDTGTTMASKVKVTTNNDYATVTFDGNSNAKSLERNVTLSDNKITEIPITITSQEGNSIQTSLYIEKLSGNVQLNEITVNREEPEKTGDYEYRAYIYDSINQSDVSITAADSTSKIVRVNADGEIYLDNTGTAVEDTGSLTFTVDTLTKQTYAYFKIISESGNESPIYTVLIEKMSTDNSLLEVYVNGEFIYPDADGKYRAQVLDTVLEPGVKAVTNSETANVRIALGEEYLHIAEGTVEMSNSNSVTIVPITVRAQAGVTKVHYLYITKISTSVGLSKVTVDDNEADSYIESLHTYTFLVEKGKTPVELSVLAESELTTLIYEGTEYGNALIESIDLDPDTNGKTLKVTAKSESGSMQEYTINLVYESDETGLEFLNVNGVDVVKGDKEKDTFTVAIKGKATKTLLEAKTINEFAQLRIGDNSIRIGYDKGELDCSDLTIDRIVVPIVVTAPDGSTTRTYNLILVREHNIIEGNITTENVDGIYKATVSVYLTSDKRKIGDSTNPRQVIESVETEDDGSFSLEVNDAETYDIVITKPGYLTFMMINVTIEQAQNINIGKHDLIAGDISADEQIDIDDLSTIIDHYGNVGVVADTASDAEKEAHAKKALYDLNEDGVVDKLDRAIIKKNYEGVMQVVDFTTATGITITDGLGNVVIRSMMLNSSLSAKFTSIAEETKVQETFIKPVKTEYEITSEYGTRVHPITGETKTHHGIDISPEHHAEVYAVADGEITFAGIQSGYGNCIEIKHTINGEDIYTFYAHLSQIDVELGQTVKQGTRIALEGGDPDTDPNPGSSTGHHLHFEFRTIHNDSHSSVDPSNYIEL